MLRLELFEIGTVDESVYVVFGKGIEQLLDIRNVRLLDQFAENDDLHSTGFLFSDNISSGLKPTSNLLENSFFTKDPLIRHQRVAQ